jgi:fructokinase
MKNTTARPVVFGEVLFDHFADGSVVLGGAPFNVAWHLQAFGQTPLFISQVGDDPLGRQVRESMLAWHMDTAGLGLDSAHPTGIVNVAITDGEPDYDICSNRAYDFIDPDSLPPLAHASILYHGTLALRGDVSRQALENLKCACSMKSFVDINLRAPWWDLDDVRQIMSDASWIKLNEDELAQIVPDKPDTERRIERLLSQLSVEQLVITRGEAGALCISSNGERLAVSPDSATTVVDVVGAGDAFSSVMLLGQIQGWPLALTLQRAQEFASAIVGLRGATIKDIGFYQPFITAWGLAA